MEINDQQAESVVEEYPSTAMISCFGMGDGGRPPYFSFPSGIATLRRTTRSRSRALRWFTVLKYWPFPESLKRGIRENFVYYVNVMIRGVVVCATESMLSIRWSSSKIEFCFWVRVGWRGVKGVKGRQMDPHVRVTQSYEHPAGVGSRECPCLAALNVRGHT